jgi:hypothetical protein
MQYPVIAQPQYGFAPTMPMMAKGGSVEAENVRAQGRNNDTMLVHMTPREVGGLQALAMQHGGSLTINPKTGLPEAGFLDAILPIAAGFALGPAGFALMSAPAAALTVGGVTALATGDLGRGLMAGLGAFGGANLGTALSTTGAGAETLAALPEAGATALPTAAEQAAGQSLLSQSISSTPGMSLAPGAASPYGTGLLQAAGTPTIQAAAPALTMTPTQVAAMQVQPSFSTVGPGISDLASPGGFGRFTNAFSNASGGTMGTTLGVTGMAAPVLNAMQPTYDFPTATPESSNYAGPYTPTPRDVRYPTDEERKNIGSSEYMYFNPSNPVPYAEGGKVENAKNTAVTPEARVLQNIAAVQQLAGVPSIAPVNAPQPVVVPVNNPAAVAPTIPQPPTIGPVMPIRGGEQDYGFRPLSADSQNPAISQGLQFFRFKDDGNPVRRMTRALMPQAYSSPENYEAYTPTGRVDMAEYYYDPAMGGYVPKSSSGGGLFGGLFGFSEGGSVPTLENGGFVLTKKAVDGLGKGDNKKGQQVASAGLGAIPIRGKGTGTSDSIKTSIDGKRPARVSNGEAYVPKKQVAKHGGAKKFYALMKKAERRA